jgi:hypothetical protein
VEKDDWPEGLRVVEQAEGFLAGFPEETALRRQAWELRRELAMAPVNSQKPEPLRRRPP